MKVLQITDPHLYGHASAKLRGVEADSTLRNVLDDAFMEVPDYAAILVTGDLVQDDPAGYLRFRSIFSNCPKPVLCIPGNHDEPEAMSRALCEPPFQIGGTYRAAGWQLVMLDSYYAGHAGGRLTEQELVRLDRALGESHEHAMVCLHHHPVAMHSRWLDGVGLANPDDFWRIIDAHTHVRAVTWGHVHQELDSQRGTVRLFATPSTGAQFLPHSERFAVDSRPPAYRPFALHPDGRIETAVRWVHAVPLRPVARGR